MIKACSWNRFDEEQICQQIDVHKDVSIIDDLKCINSRCPYIYLRIQNATSLNKCAGNILFPHSLIIKIYLLFILYINFYISMFIFYSF